MILAYFNFILSFSLTKRDILSLKLKREGKTLTTLQREVFYVVVYNPKWVKG